MDLQQLPDAWDELTLADIGLGAVVDNILGWPDRLDGAVAVVVTDAHDRILAPFVVTQVPLECDLWELHAFVTQLADIATHVAPGGGLALGVGRPGDLTPTAEDEAWLSALELACEEAGLSARGCVLATPFGVTALAGEPPAA